MMIQMAFDKSLIGWPLEFRAFPKEFSFDTFAQIWQRVGQTLSFMGALKNSLFVSLGAAILSVSLGASMAYAFARYRFSGRKVGLFGLMLGALLPPVALMTPLYILLTILKLRTSLWGLMIVYTAFSMPFCIWNMRAAFQAIPKELEEASYLDGAGALKSFWNITLPIALPSIAIAGLLAFLAGYTEFAMAWLFVDQGKNVTLAMALSGMLGSPKLGGMAALALLMTFPVVLIFIFLQRYILNSLLIGRVGD
jgi:arabinogalactan oligomer/maltooligosaccharide transport system permease protein